MYRVVKKEIKIKTDRMGQSHTYIRTTYESTFTGRRYEYLKPYNTLSRSEREERKYFDNIHHGSMKKIYEAYEEYRHTDEW